MYLNPSHLYFKSARKTLWIIKIKLKTERPAIIKIRNISNNVEEIEIANEKKKRTQVSRVLEMNVMLSEATMLQIWFKNLYAVV